MRWARHYREELDKQVAQRGGAPPRIFAVVQGGGIEALRRQCATALAEIGFDGYGFGGWPLAADGTLLANPMRWVVESLPPEAPKHALGVGRPNHMVKAFALGYSVFDCALPTRDARHGRLYAFRDGWSHTGQSPATTSTAPSTFTISRAGWRTDRSRTAVTARSAPCIRRPTCITCSRFGDTSAERLATLHNLRFYMQALALLRS